MDEKENLGRRAG